MARVLGIFSLVYGLNLLSVLTYASNRGGNLPWATSTLARNILTGKVGQSF